jgi:hypothetical protein
MPRQWMAKPTTAVMTPTRWGLPLVSDFSVAIPWMVMARNVDRAA